MLPNKFTVKEAEEICKSEFKPSFIGRYIREGGYLEIYHQGTNGSKTDVRIYKKVK